MLQNGLKSKLQDTQYISAWGACKWKMCKTNHKATWEAAINKSVK